MNVENSLKVCKMRDELGTGMSLQKPESPESVFWKALAETAPKPESLKASFKEALRSIADLTETGTVSPEEAETLLRHVAAAAVSLTVSESVGNYLLCPKCRERKRRRSLPATIFGLSMLMPFVHQR